MKAWILAAAALAGCGGALPDESVACADVFVEGLQVTVVSASTGALICDAAVTATDGAYHETLQPSHGPSSAPAPGPCDYIGAGERAGTYRVDATNGAATGAVEVVVTRDQCHVQTRSVTIRL